MELEQLANVAAIEVAVMKGQVHVGLTASFGMRGLCR
jgi:hypothetical protein